jgi:4-hydroxy-3-methylbut-2-enyl diphosphate reductase
MRINIAKSSGFCFGVKRALDIVKEVAKNQKDVVMLGDIVHNERVIKEITKLGIKKINRLSKNGNKVLIIRAHGEPKRIFDLAKKFNYKIIDATCPMVKEIHRIAKDMEEKGYFIIVIGDKNHDEVRGIVGQLNKKAMVIEDIKDIDINKIKKLKKVAVVVQSTQELDKVLKIVEVLKRYIKELKFFNTICMPTRIKQKEIKEMPKKNDCMIIIGSKNSANTKRLYEISKKLNQKTYWVNSAGEIKELWFKSVNTIGITAGASTPDETIKEVIKHIKLIKNIKKLNL